jgi:hypothetical protein
MTTAAVTPLTVRRGAGCDRCGRPLDAVAVAVEGTVRSVVYAYCGPACRAEHAADVAATPASCGRCPDDAEGDTGRCPRHLDAEAAEQRQAPGELPLAG